MKKAMLIIFLSFIFVITAFPQYTIRPSTLSVQSIIRTAPNVMTFSIYFNNNAVDSAIAYSGGQFHLDFNKAILNGGTGTLAVISSGLPANVQSTNPTVYTTSTPGQLRAAPKAPPGALVGGYLVNAGDSVLVAKFSLSTSASSFLNWTSHNITWRKVPDANPVSKVSAYIWNSNQIISSNTNFVIYPTNSKELNLTALIEGFYDGGTDIMISDTVTVELRNSINPWGLVEETKSLLNSSGSGIVNFFAASEATNYYIVIKHRNAVETWSANTPQFVSGTLTYDFTSAQNQAYGNNLMQKGTKWCLYSGDVDHDGSVDLTDMIEVDNDNALFITGYVPSDVNGDGSTDLSDMIIVDNNNAAFVGKVTPTSLAKENRNNYLLKVENNK